ncbi:MAG: hypothetical protein QNJ68_18520 [Microcoleaceae cyanobacterium MO_207.B10]|nr:hypothetical protein [Microcoleaceae cyanobacterium MO_207.B10]
MKQSTTILHKISCVAPRQELKVLFINGLLAQNTRLTKVSILNLAESFLVVREFISN